MKEKGAARKEKGANKAFQVLVYTLSSKENRIVNEVGEARKGKRKDERVKRKNVEMEYNRNRCNNE